MSVPKFAQVQHSFHTELKTRINNYFEKTGKSQYGNFSLFLKAALLITGFTFLYIHLVFFTPNVFGQLQNVCCSAALYLPLVLTLCMTAHTVASARINTLICSPLFH